MSPKLEKELIDKALGVLGQSAALLRQRLDTGDVDELAWEVSETEIGTEIVQARVDGGWLSLHVSQYPVYPGYTFSMNRGIHADNSFGGFLPGVTLHEAMLLAYGAYTKLAYPDRPELPRGLVARPRERVCA